jgi:crotonobetainyl-CoA:carnitine CoA-transferase CaiB-like acyl-CoA transferase
VPVGPVYTVADLFRDPHPRAREMLVEVAQPAAGAPVVIAGLPIKLTATPGGIYRRPPRLGEHNDEIRRELGLDAPAAAPVSSEGGGA